MQWPHIFQNNYQVYDVKIGQNFDSKRKNNADFTAVCSWIIKLKRRNRGRYKKLFPPCSQGLGGSVGHAFRHMHTYPPLSSWTDNWTVLWRIWTLKGNLSHLIIGIQRMLFICINTNKTHSLSAQREPFLKRKSDYKTPIFLCNWTKDYRK